MSNRIANANILYVNRLTNQCYVDGEILELTRHTKPNESIKDTVFDLFAKYLTRCEEQKEVYHYLMYEQNTISVPNLCKILSQRSNKSERTYRRAIDNLRRGKIIIISHSIISCNIDYDISLLDLDDAKSLIIHIEKS